MKYFAVLYHAHYQANLLLISIYCQMLIYYAALSCQLSIVNRQLLIVFFS